MARLEIHEALAFTLNEPYGKARRSPRGGTARGVLYQKSLEGASALCYDLVRCEEES